MSDSATKRGKVYLIGAGPGDPKLLTIKAAEAISASDVVVYDYLVNPEVLRHARPGVELVYAGKRAGQASISQAEINSLLIGRALDGQTVARLKGGDPFIFGRGGEEAESLVRASVDWEVIPGVSSGVAAASYAGIPLTHRDHASSVIFITGHDSPGKRAQAVDWAAIARAADTLVVFMCAETITKIAREIIAAGRLPHTPVAIIRWGTYEHQEIYTGTLDELAQSDEMGPVTIEPPAIAIIGPVVSLREKLVWLASREFDLRAMRAAKVQSEVFDGAI
jgi:uroporphyrin-III C-methyltransferase